MRLQNQSLPPRRGSLQNPGFPSMKDTPILSNLQFVALAVLKTPVEGPEFMWLTRIEDRQARRLEQSGIAKGTME